MASDGLFDVWLPALWTKARPEGKPPMWIMHRFLSSDPDFAQAARELQRDLTDPEITFRVWQGLLPKERGAPRLQYPAPKRGPGAEELVQKIMAAEAVNRKVAEEVVGMLEMMDALPSACVHYGVDLSEKGE